MVIGDWSYSGQNRSEEQSLGGAYAKEKLLLVYNSGSVYKRDAFDWCIIWISQNTVELRWLELVGTVCASSTHPCDRAIPSQTIFELVHV